MNVLRIAVDFGGVLSRHDSGHRGEDVPVSENKQGKGHHNTRIDVPDALRVLRDWKAAGHRLYVVSFCGRRRAGETRASIDATCPGLFEDMYFTKTKLAKARMCRHIGAHLLVDDSTDVLEFVKAHAPLTRRYLFENRDGEWDALAALVRAQSDILGWITVAPDPLPHTSSICYPP